MNTPTKSGERDPKCKTCGWWEAFEEVCGRCFHPQSNLTHTSPSTRCKYYEGNMGEMWYALKENIGLVAKDKTKKDLMAQLGLASSSRVRTGVYRGQKGGEDPVFIYGSRELAADDDWKL